MNGPRSLEKFYLLQKGGKYMKFSPSSSVSKEILRIHDSKENNLAEPSSAQSDPPLISLRAQFTKPWEALKLIYLSIPYKAWETEVLIRTIAYRAYSNNYNGQWRIVQELLEAELQSTEQFLEIFLKYKSKEEYYGNLLHNIKKYEKYFLLKVTQGTDNRPVKRPQRKRGYADKGSRRLPHEYHGDPPISREREDRRKKVYHPLLRE